MTTQATPPLQTQAEDAVLLAIQQLGLPSLSADMVVAVRRPWVQRGGDWIIYPGISIHGGPEVEDNGTNQREDIGYPVFVTMVAPSDPSRRSSRDLLPSWREPIRRRFIHGVLSNVAISGGLFLRTRCVPGAFPHPEGDDKYESSTLKVLVWMREPRG